MEKDNLELIKTYYHVKSLTPDADRRDELIKIADSIAASEITENSYDNNIKGLILLIAGKKTDKSNYYNQAVDFFLKSRDEHTPDCIGLNYNEVQLNLGNAYNLLDKGPEAKEIFLDLIRTNEKRFRAIAQISYSYTCFLNKEYKDGLDNASSGIDYFSSGKITEKNNNYYCHGLNNRGLNYLGLGKYDSAQRDFNEASNLCPDFTDIKNNLEHSELFRIGEKVKTGNYSDKEITDLYQTIEKTSLSSELHNIANNYYENQNYSAAERILDIIVKSDEDFSPSIILKSLISWKINSDTEFPIARLDKIENHDPYFHVSQNILGCIYYNLEAYEDALKCFIKASRHADGENNASYWKNLGLCYYEPHLPDP